MKQLTKIFVTGCIVLLTAVGVKASDFGKSVTWDRHSLMIDGRRGCPVMGEVHYSRIPADEWADEVKIGRAHV